MYHRISLCMLCSIYSIFANAPHFSLQSDLQMLDGEFVNEEKLLRRKWARAPAAWLAALAAAQTRNLWIKFVRQGLGWAGLGWADISPFVGRNDGTIHLLRGMYFEQFVNPASKHVQILILSWYVK